MMAGSDVVGLAQTGTGKTAAFAIPILSKIDPANKTTQALVLAPTRELALQVAEAFSRYGAHLPQINVLPIYGGSSYGPQLAGLRRGAQVVVGTPGRVIDHLEKGTLDLTHLDYLVLDEADEMLQMGFAEDVERILADTPEYKQVALFSATMPPAIRKITKKYLHDAGRGDGQVENRHRREHHAALHPGRRSTQDGRADPPAGGRAVRGDDRVRPHQAGHRGGRRETAGPRVLRGGDQRRHRRRHNASAPSRRSRTARIDILVATDVAARGLDVERIAHVLNYDIPHDTESYVHRIGRTGRAGRSGQALLFVSPRERHMLKSIEKATRQQLIEAELPTVDHVNAQRVAKFRDSITDALGAPGFELFRRMIEDYERENDVPMVDIAAALAAQSRDGEQFLMSEPPPEKRRERDDRPGRDDRGPKRSRERRGDFATYRIAVGKRHKVMPGAIVGAIANEGGLNRSDFGHISIRPDHSLVELPAEACPKRP